MEYHRVSHVDSTRNDILLIPEARLEDQGVWECVNKHMKSKVEYRTALIKLRVLKAGSKVDPERIRSGITTVIFACGSSFAICVYIIIMAAVTKSLGRRTLSLRGNLKNMNKNYVRAQLERFAYKETTSPKDVLPHILHRQSSTAR